MMRFVEAMAPTYTLLVHGDDDARQSLVNKIHPRFHPMLSENGETYPFTKRENGKGVVGKRYKRNSEQERLRSYIGSVLLYQKEMEKHLNLSSVKMFISRWPHYIAIRQKAKWIK